MEVKILEVCKVRPSPGSPTATDEIILPLTFFDLFNCTSAPAELLQFYEKPSHHSHSIMVSNLKHSLSQTLQYFLPVAGRLVWLQSSPYPFIRYKVGDGVSLTITESDDDFYYLSGEKYRECTRFQPLVAQIVRMGSEVPLIAFKITIFPKGGICIGVTTNHALFDGKSVLLFVSSWAYLTKLGNNRGLGKEFIPDFHQKWVRERYPELENSFLNNLKQKEVTPGEEWPPMRPKGMMRGTFVLSQSDIGLLKGLVISRLVSNSSNNQQETHVSTFSIMFAYMILCLVKAKPTDINSFDVSFYFDGRDRLEPPLPRNYFGNCLGPCVKHFNREELSGWDGMALIVNFIKTAIKNLQDDGALKGAQEWPSMFKTDVGNESLIITVYGSTKFDFHNIDFGWGRARKADIASIDGMGGISFSRDDSKGEIEAELSLNECEMKKFAYLFDQGLIEAKKPITASF